MQMKPMGRTQCQNRAIRGGSCKTTVISRHLGKQKRRRRLDYSALMRRLHRVRIRRNDPLPQTLRMPPGRARADPLPKSLRRPPGRARADPLPKSLRRPSGRARAASARLRSWFTRAVFAVTGFAEPMAHPAASNMSAHIIRRKPKQRQLNGCPRCWPNAEPGMCRVSLSGKCRLSDTMSVAFTMSVCRHIQKASFGCPIPCRSADTAHNFWRAAQMLVYSSV